MNVNLTEFATANEGFSLISNAKLVALYTAMVACRKKAENAHRRNGRPAIGSAVPVMGFEAAIVAATIDLGAKDKVAPAIWPNGVLKVINPAVRHVATPEAAIRAALKATNWNNALVFFATGKRAEQAAWRNALNQAAAHRLPILFVSLLRTDGPGLHPASVNGHSRIGADSTKENSHPIPSIDVDGNDVVAVYRVVSEAMTHARKGHGPTRIECHGPASEDALENMRKYLIRKGLAEDAL